MLELFHLIAQAIEAVQTTGTSRGAVVILVSGGGGSLSSGGKTVDNVDDIARHIETKFNFTLIYNSN